VGLPSSTLPSPPALGPLAPALLGTPIEGINFDQDASTSGFYEIPPDPIGAAGSNQVVSVVNTTIDFFTKAGALQRRQRLGKNGTTAVGSFFETLAPANGLFDPKVIYDQYAGRFLVVALEQVASPSDSRILLAVSAGDDPNGSWYFLAINSKITVSGSSSWADYPGLAVDDKAVYITGNMFSFSSGSYQGTRLWIVNKMPLYTNGTPVVAVYDPYGLVGGGSAGTLQPAHVYGAGGVGANAGTFLISAGWTSGANDLLQVIRVDNPTNSPSFTAQSINLGDIHDGSIPWPDAPQAGTTHLIASNDIRPLGAVWRNSNLYVVNTVVPPTGPDAGQATAHWYRINTSNLSALALTDQGNIGGEDIALGTYTFFPSIAVDSAGNLGIGFAASGTNIYPGAYYTGRKAADPAGTVQPAVALASGQDYYYRAFGGTENRWGDYSGIALDPANESVFWVFNEYALARGTVLGSYPTQDGRWGTRWGNFAFAVSLAGTVAYYPTNYPPSALSTNRVGNVTMSLTGDTTLTTNTLADGSYGLTNIPAGGTYCVTPSKVDDSSADNGVDAIDQVLIQRHILGRTPDLLDSPYKLLAADVDDSGQIDAIDQVLIQRLILGRSSQFPAGLWRFVPTNYVFLDPQNPWNASSNLWYTNLVADVTHGDFVAIKLGDVNNSWTAPAGAQSLLAKSAQGQQALGQNVLPEVVFAVSQQSAQPGQTVAARVTASGFSRVTSAQFSLVWDPTVLRYVGTGSYGLTGLGAGCFGTGLTASGKLGFAWYDPEADGVTLADGTVLFRVSFEVIGKVGSVSAVALAGAPTAQVVSVDVTRVAFGAQDGNVSVVGPGVLVTTPGYANGAFRLSVPTEKGRSYVLEFTEALTPAKWTALPAVVGDGTVMVLVNPTATNQHCFYRVRVQ
jgi:hypothetical protein